MGVLLKAMLCGAVIMQISNVANADLGWKTTRYTQSVDVKGKAAADFTYTGIMVETADTSKPQIKFGCSEAFGLTATINFVPLDEAELVAQDKVDVRVRRSNIYIEGRKPVNVLWTHIRDSRTVQTRKQQFAAMLYNAVVQSKPFEIKEPLKSRMQFTPPSPDAEFRDFAANCPKISG